MHRFYNVVCRSSEGSSVQVLRCNFAFFFFFFFFLRSFYGSVCGGFTALFCRDCSVSRFVDLLRCCFAGIVLSESFCGAFTVPGNPLCNHRQSVLGMGTGCTIVTNPWLQPKTVNVEGSCAIVQDPFQDNPRYNCRLSVYREAVRVTYNTLLQTPLITVTDCRCTERLYVYNTLFKKTLVTITDCEGTERLYV